MWVVLRKSKKEHDIPDHELHVLLYMPGTCPCSRLTRASTPGLTVSRASTDSTAMNEPPSHFDRVDLSHEILDEVALFGLLRFPSTFPKGLPSTPLVLYCPFEFDLDFAGYLVLKFVDLATPPAQWGRYDTVPNRSAQLTSNVIQAFTVLSLLSFTSPIASAAS